jgi:heme/copper-type cytochrome/quinol oxidase subunit 2
LERVRRILLGGPASAALIVLMLAGCLFLWVGVPVLWLWIGSQLEGSVELGTALMVTMVGAIGTIVCVAPLLVRLNRHHVELREARGLPIGENSPLEVMLVVSAVIAMVGGAVWFFGFSGSSPVPLNLSY